MITDATDIVIHTVTLDWHVCEEVVDGMSVLVGSECIGKDLEDLELLHLKSDQADVLVEVAHDHYL